MTRARVVALASIMVVSGALVAALLVSFAYDTLGPVPGPPGEPYGRTPSPDGRWVAQSYYVSEDLPRGRVTVEPTDLNDHGEAVVAYYGAPANAVWRGDALVVTEQLSGRPHVIGVPEGRWDSRTDDSWEFWGDLLPVVAIVAGVVVFDVRLLRRWTHQLAGTSAVASNGCVRGLDATADG